MQEITGKDLKGKKDCFVFIYSRFCGTCHVARSFLVKIEQTHKQGIFHEMNASLSPNFLQEFKIESVPCLLIIHNYEIQEKIYTFYSVGNIYQYLFTYYPALFAQT